MCDLTSRFMITACPPRDNAIVDQVSHVRKHWQTVDVNARTMAAGFKHVTQMTNQSESGDVCDGMNRLAIVANHACCVCV